MTDFGTIDTVALARRLEQGGDLEFWNVLTDQYFHGEFIPGSRRVPENQVADEVERLDLAKDAEIIVYCAGPSCPSSRNAARALAELGYSNVLAYEDGLEHWQQSGRPLERLEVATTSA